MYTIFVYGSLKRGQLLHGALIDQKFLGLATTCLEYALFDCGEYPALVKVAANGDAVKGELYRVDSICLQKLDQIEGVDEGLYVREPVSLQDAGEYPDGPNRVWAWFYLHSIHGLRRCGSEWP